MHDVMEHKRTNLEMMLIAAIVVFVSVGPNLSTAGLLLPESFTKGTFYCLVS